MFNSSLCFLLFPPSHLSFGVDSVFPFECYMIIPLNHFPKPVRDLIAGNAMYIWFTTYFYSLVIFFRNGDWKYSLWSVLFLFTVEILWYKEGVLLVGKSFD